MLVEGDHIMLHAMDWEQDHLRLADVHCTAEAGWSDDEVVGRLGIVFVRRGHFRRRVRGMEALVDAGSWYLQRPGTVERFYHPGDVDVCLSISWSEPLYEMLGEPQDAWPRTPQPTPAEWLPHLAAIMRQIHEPADAFDASEHILRAVGSATNRLPSPQTARTPAQAQDLVDRARELLCEGTCTTLWELARQLQVSPYVLSRTFQAVAGLSVTRYRRRLRLHHARYLVEEGWADLAQVAAEVGFADQAHFTRAMQAEWQITPAILRQRVRGGS